MITIVQRGAITDKQQRMHKIVAVLLSLLVLSIYFLMYGKNPITVYISLIQGSIGTKFRIISTIKYMIPLFLVGLAICFAFKLRFWNIGGEGQIIMGAIFATYCALHFASLPKIILLPLMAIAGILGGGLYGVLSAFIKEILKTDETIITLMLNYLALYFLTFLQYDAWKDPDSLGFPKIAQFADNAILPSIFGLHVGWIFAIVIGVLAHIILTKTKFGFEISVVGESSRTAEYAGINAVALTFITMFVSGGIAGLVGMIQASAVMKTLSLEITMGIGYTGIIIAWLGGLKPLNVAIVSIFFAMLTQGGYFLQSAQGIPASSIAVFQATILFFVLASEFFGKFKFIKNNGGKIK